MIVIVILLRYFSNLQLTTSNETETCESYNLSDGWFYLHLPSTRKGSFPGNGKSASHQTMSGRSGTASAGNATSPTAISVPPYGATQVNKKGFVQLRLFHVLGNYLNLHCIQLSTGYTQRKKYSCTECF